MRFFFSMLALVAVIGLAGCPTQPVLNVSTNTLFFDQGDTELTFEVWNSGAGNLLFEVEDDRPWISVTPEIASSEGPDDVVLVTVTLTEPEAKADAFYEGTITVSSQNQTRVIAVTTAPDLFTEEFDSEDNDLQNLALTFTPSETNSYYSATVTNNVIDFLSDPDGGTDLVPFLAVTDPVSMPLWANKEVWLYGQAYDTLHVGSDGYIGLGDDAAGGRVGLDLAAHFSAAGISAFFTNFDLSETGMVSAKQFSDRVAVTWEGVSEAGADNDNSFQVEMFFDGDIRLTYLGLDATEGIAGLSGDSLPDTFYESDLSSYNTAPLKAANLF
jgi:hypothetical protein